MPSEPSVAPKALSIDAAPPIENEIPTYRAVSPMAVCAAILGALSGLSFTSQAWLPAAGLAILAGWLADFSIRRRPDALTGRSFAQAGMAMGLIFGITSFASAQWTTYALGRDALKFSGEIVKAMNALQKQAPEAGKRADTSDVVWFMIPPQMRRGMSPGEAKGTLAKMFKESEKIADVHDRIRKMCARAGPDLPITIEGLEDAWYLGLDGYATVVLKIDEAPHAHAHSKDEAPEPEGSGYAMLRLREDREVGRNRWFVDYLFYPYVPRSYKHEVKPPDDGHGH